MHRLPNLLSGHCCVHARYQELSMGVKYGEAGTEAAWSGSV
jgi:hypothetical protein